MIGVLQNTKFATIISVVYRVNPLNGRVECESDIRLWATELAGNRLVRFVGRVVDTFANIRQPKKQTAVQRNRKGRI